MRSKWMQARVRRATGGAVAVLVALHAMSGVALAGTVIVPEIDGGTVATGLGLLSAGVLMLRARFSK
jgi:hypothetical protein